MVRLGMLGVVADAKFLVIVDSKVMVGRRRRHRAGVRRRRPQGQSSPLWPQWAVAWPLVPRSRTSSGRRSGPSDLFQPYVTHMYILAGGARWPLASPRVTRGRLLFFLGALRAPLHKTVSRCSSTRISGRAAECV